MNTEDSKMITAKGYAEMHNVHYTTVMNWLRRDLVPGATAADSNDWRLTYTAHSDVESPVEALRRASQTDGSKRRDSSAAFAEDGLAEARLEKIREERSASE